MKGSGTRTIGDRDFFAAVENAGVSIPMLGLSMECQDKKQDVILFAGAIGTAFSNQFIPPATIPSHAGAGYAYKRDWKRFELASIGLSNGTELGSLRFKGGPYTLSATSGLLERSPYTNFSGNARFKLLDATASHSLLIYNKQTANLNSVSLSGGLPWFNLHASAFQSSLGTGEAYGASLNKESYSIRADYFASRSRFTVLSATEKGQRLRLTESATIEHGTLSFAGGIGYMGRNWTIDIENQTLYYPFSGQFQRTYTANFTLALARGINIAASTLALPNGTKMSASLDSIFGNGSHSDSSYHSMGKYEIDGVVHDEHGSPVEGAAIKIGNEIVYTDADGNLMLRVSKQKAYAFSVLPDEFLQGRSYKVIQAPASVQPGSSVVIIVSR